VTVIYLVKISRSYRTPLPITEFKKNCILSCFSSIQFTYSVRQGLLMEFSSDAFRLRLWHRPTVSPVRNTPTRSRYQYRLIFLSLCHYISSRLNVLRSNQIVLIHRQSLFFVSERQTKSIGNGKHTFGNSFGIVCWLPSTRHKCSENTLPWSTSRGQRLASRPTWTQTLP
jgi:hypothetical protein